MPLLAQLLISLFGALARWLSRLLVERVAVRVAAVATLGALAAALLVAFNAAVSPLAAQLFSTPYGQLLGLAFPPVSGTVLATVAGTWAACTVYRLKVQAVKVAASI